MCLAINWMSCKTEILTTLVIKDPRILSLWQVESWNNFSLDNYRFTKMVVGCVLIGLGFGVPTIVYRKDSIPMPVRVIIHMGIGCVVYTIVAYAVGWIGGSATLGQGIIIAAIQFAVAFVIWILFLRYYRAEAKKMNEKIQAMK